MTPLPIPAILERSPGGRKLFAYSEAQMVEYAKAERKAARAEAEALLREAREQWVKVGYGASHEDVAECRDFCERIDAYLAGGKT